MSFPDMYEAINRGTIDALGDMAIVLANAFKHYEVVKAVYSNAPPGVNGNGGALASGFFMSQKKFNAFPKDTQKLLMDLRRDYGVHLAQGLMNDEGAIRKEWETKHGVKFFNASPEDAKFIQEAGNAANEQLIKKQEADGHKNVRQVWTYYLEARKKHEAERKKK
jgi:TRAP-type C4-dicarboxylate transport system substrate-binding protein